MPNPALARRHEKHPHIASRRPHRCPEGDAMRRPAIITITTITTIGAAAAAAAALATTSSAQPAGPPTGELHLLARAQSVTLVDNPPRQHSRHHPPSRGDSRFGNRRKPAGKRGPHGEGGRGPAAAHAYVAAARASVPSAIWAICAYASRRCARQSTNDHA